MRQWVNRNYTTIVTFIFMKQIYIPRQFLLVVLSIISMHAICQNVNDLKLKDYHPVSIYKIPETKIEKAKYPVIDFHSHDYPNRCPVR
jgi:hypothetical protein